jgi:hypothetical protein
MPQHRLLEAFLLRLARAPDAGAFVLRGGMRVRQLVPAAGRPARDVDLVCRLPYDPRDVARRIRAVLADDHVRDGAWFDPAARFAPWWRPGHPGLHVLALGAVDGVPGRIAVDLAFGLPLWPEPELGPLATRRGAARLWMSRPEALIGRKLQVVTQLGRGGWRPKDLWDLDLLLAHAAPDRAVLGAAVEAAFAGCAESLADAREVFGHPGWWEGRRAEVRWHRFADGTGGPVHDDLAATVASVRRSLAPVLGIGA